MRARGIDGAEDEVNFAPGLLELSIGGMQLLPDELDVLCRDRGHLHLDAHNPALALLKGAVSLHAARGGSVDHGYHRNRITDRGPN